MRIVLRSLFQETIFTNGVPATVNYIVKNAAFSIEIDGTGNLERVNFAKAKITAGLIYSESLAEVQLPSNKPAVTYICHPEVGRATLDTRVQILSSSAEGQHFRVRVSIQIPNQPDAYTAISDPIRCVSKLEQVRRKISLAAGASTTKKKKSAQESNEEDDWEEENSYSAAVPALKKRKRASTEELYASLAMLKENQERMLDMLKKQAQQQHLNLPRAALIKQEEEDEDDDEFTGEEEWVPRRTATSSSMPKRVMTSSSKRAKRAEVAGPVAGQPHVFAGCPSDSVSRQSVEDAFLSVLLRWHALPQSAREQSAAHLTKALQREQAAHLKDAFQELVLPLLEKTVQPEQGRCVFKACPSAMLANQVGLIMQDVASLADSDHQHPAATAHEFLDHHQQQQQQEQQDETNNRMDEDDSISSYTDDVATVSPNHHLLQSHAHSHGRQTLLGSSSTSLFPTAWSDADAADLLF
jgi:hypothetical protein